MQSQQIRRRTNGTIDIDFYRQTALQLRSETMTEFLRGTRGVARALLGVGVIAAPLAVAALVHAVNPAPPHQTAAMNEVALHQR